MVAVPRREVYAELQSVFLTSCRKFFQYISFTVFPIAFSYSMRTVFAWKQAKAIMMLGCDDDRFHASCFGSTGPLAGIQLSRIKYFRVFIAMPPLLVCESIGAKVDKHIVLHVLPFQLV